MMDSINFGVDEIVTTCDAALTYTYVHLRRKARAEELGRGIAMLSSTYGVVGSLVFGYDVVSSSSALACELIEDHPGFRILVQHEELGKSTFHRWTAGGYSGVNCGYNLLKAKLLARGGSGASSSSGASASANGGNTAAGDNEGEGGPPPGSGSTAGEHSEGGRRKRGRSASPDRGRDYFEIAMDRMNATVSSAIASAVSSSGSAVASAVASERDRLERAEQQLREIEMQRRLVEERTRIEAEVAARYESRADHLAALKAKDEAHLAALETKDKELKSKDEALAAREAEFLELRRLAAEAAVERDALRVELGKAKELAAVRQRALSDAVSTWDREAEKAEARANRWKTF